RCQVFPTADHRITRRAANLVAAAASGAGVIASVERTSAGAARNRIGIVHGEAAAHQAIHEVDLGALDVAGAHRVDEQANAADLGNGVTVFRLILEAHAVRHAGAAARLDEDPQPHLGAP